LGTGIRVRTRRCCLATHTLTIGKVAKAAGIGVETVRFYERQGLIADPPRTASGYRKYTAETVERLRFIRRAKALGFTLDEIGELLGLRICGGHSCGAVRSLASEKLSDIERRIAALERMATVLRGLVTSCDDGRESDACPILDALAEDADAA
jgi:MerR family mercuric resistance operon transcriptional regulator